MFIIFVKQLTKKQKIMKNFLIAALVYVSIVSILLPVFIFLLNNTK